MRRFVYGLILFAGLNTDGLAQYTGSQGLAAGSYAYQQAPACPLPAYAPSAIYSGGNGGTASASLAFIQQPSCLVPVFTASAIYAGGAGAYNDRAGVLQTPSCLLPVYSASAIYAGGQDPGPARAAAIVQGSACNIPPFVQAAIYSGGNGSGQALVTRIVTGSNCQVPPSLVSAIYTGGQDGGSARAAAIKACQQNPLVVSIQQGATLTLCQNQTQILNTLVSGGAAPYQYSWSPSLNLSDPHIANPVFTAAQAGNFSYTVTVTDNAGQQDSASISVQVNALPAPATAISGPAQVCSGSQNVAYSTSASGALSYSWALFPSGAGVITGNGAQTSVDFNTNFSGTAQLIVSGVNACGEGDSTVLNLTIDPGTPAVFTMPVTAFCTGTLQVPLSATPAGGSFSGPGVSGGSFYPMLAGAGTHTLSYTYQNAGGCTSMVSQIVTVDVSPQLSVTSSGSTTLCAGNSVTLTASGATGYQWSNGATSASVTVNATGTYTVTGYNGACSDTASQTVTVLPQPSAAISLSGPATICQGQSVTLTASGGTSYLWSTGSASPSITVNAAGSYSVVVFDGNCSDTAIQVINVQALPVAQVVANGPLTFCEGGNVSLTATGGTSYLWSTGSTVQTIMIANSGTYTVTVTDNGCSAQSSVTVVEEAMPQISWNVPDTLCTGSQTTLFAQPAGGVFSGTGVSGNILTAPSVTGNIVLNYTYTTTVCTASAQHTVYIEEAPVALFSTGTNGYTVTLTDLSSGNGQNTWDVNGSIYHNQQQVVHTFGAAGIYDVVLTISNGCGSDTAWQKVTVGNVSVKEDPAPGAVLVYPNPFSGDVVIRSTLAEPIRRVELLSVTGSLVWLRDVDFTGEYTCVLPEDLAPGTYLLKIQAAGGQIILLRLIKAAP